VEDEDAAVAAAVASSFRQSEITQLSAGVWYDIVGIND